MADERSTHRQAFYRRMKIIPAATEFESLSSGIDPLKRGTQANLANFNNARSPR